jgi:hypothetical protein
MNAPTLVKRGTAVLALAAASTLLPNPAAAQAPQAPWNAGQWRFAATLYAYLPTIDGSLSAPLDSSSPSINVDAGTIINDLKFTIMGTFDAHNGRWGVFTDLLYLNVGGNQSKTRDFTIGSTPAPGTATADVNLDLQGLVWTVAGEYRVMSRPEWTLDVVAGARLFDVKPKLSWSLYGDLGPTSVPSRSGGSEATASNWDGIVGVKGGYRFGANREWFVPYYVDVGTGQSDLTWQVAAGVGYSFKWGDVIAMWRYLDYDFKSGSPINDMNFNGPMLGATFRW